jgi:hypothetical protein
MLRVRLLIFQQEPMTWSNLDSSEIRRLGEKKFNVLTQP